MEGTRGRRRIHVRMVSLCGVAHAGRQRIVLQFCGQHKQMASGSVWKQHDTPMLRTHLQLSAFAQMACCGDRQGHRQRQCIMLSQKRWATHPCVIMWCWTKGGFVAQSTRLGRRPERPTMKMKEITHLLRRCFSPNECCKIVGNRSFPLTQGRAATAFWHSGSCAM